MRRPSPGDVRAALRPEVRWNFGTSRLTEAVELRSGILIAEYIYTNRFTRAGGGHTYQRKLVIKPWWDRAPLSITVESGHTDQYPYKGEQ